MPIPMKNPLGHLLTTLFGVSLFGVILFLTGIPNEAEACGGFFCSQQQPVNQSAERIVFSKNEDGTMTAVVQIMYQGPSERFAWLLPISGDPEVGVSSNTALTRLQRQTAPQYNLNTEVVGECKEDRRGGGPRAAAEGGSAGPDNTDESGGDVEVVNEGSVGPYNFTVISVDETADKPARAALDWLEQNDYDLMETGPDLIRGYLEQGLNLIAFKLTKNAESGDIRPVRLEYDAPNPKIPIKLTAVAAREDMGVLVWVLGKNRAIPTRYKVLELNDALINWFKARSNYDAVVTQAADEAGGQGFVTEYADDAKTVEDVVFSDRDQRMWDEINQPEKWRDRKTELLRTVARQYGNWDGLLKVVRDTVALPDDYSAREFIREIGFRERAPTDLENFDPAAFLSALKTDVIDPMRETEKLLQSRPYITRLYSTLSPDEMTVDPVFDYNPDLSDVSNTHTGERTVFCAPDILRRNAPWKAELPSGVVVRGVGRDWPLGPGSETESGEPIPAARQISELETSGGAKVVTNNSEEINQIVAEANRNQPRRSDLTSDGSGCACSTDGSPGSVPINFLIFSTLVGLGILRRRK